MSEKKDLTGIHVAFVMLLISLYTIFHLFLISIIILFMLFLVPTLFLLDKWSLENFIRYCLVLFVVYEFFKYVYM